MATKKAKLEENKAPESQNSVKNDENSSKMSSKRVKKSAEKVIPQVETAQKERKTEIIDNHDIGFLSTEIQIEKRVEKTEFEIEGAVYGELVKASRNGEVLWGQVTSIDDAPTVANRFFVSVVYKGTKISIPDNLYFEPTFEFGNNYINKMNEEQRMEFRKQVVLFQLGANVCFCIEKVKKNLIKEGEYAGETYLTVLANRNKAMAVLRNVYFYHQGRTKSADKAPRTIEVGDIIRNANVISVKEDSIIVEAAGIESRIDAYNINNDYVTNCKKYLSPGDTMDVRVKKLYINPDSVYLSLSGRLNNSSKLVHTMHVGDMVLGVVDRYNPQKNKYTVMLKNGVTASCPAYNVKGRMPIVVGDRVMVYITNIYLDGGFVAGQASKI